MMAKCKLNREAILAELASRKENQLLVTTQAELASEVGVSDEALRLWLNGVVRPDTEKAAAIADVLGVGLEEIAELPRRFKDESWTSLIGAARTVADWILKTTDETDKYRTYISHVRKTPPLKGVVRSFEHDITKTMEAFAGRPAKNYYGEIWIRPNKWPEDKALLLDLSFWAFSGGVRFNYARLRLQTVRLKNEPNLVRLARLETFFDRGRDEGSRARAKEDGSIRVWTWFGKESCKFVINSQTREEEFEFKQGEPPDPDAGEASDDAVRLALAESKSYREALRRIPRDVICVLAAPHHVKDR